jgi:predicted metal-dependent TIM-barrel fold hydrolase
LNSKEANNEALAEEVMQILPEFATKDGVVAIGEIGFDEQTALEEKYFRLQLDLARELDLPVMIHTPHRDKKRGASRSMDIILEHKLPPSRVVIDHVNEETVREVLDRGFWAAFSIYPHSKMTAARMCEIVRGNGAERLIVDSACDWGISDPLSVPKTALLLAEQGISPDDVARVTYGNALSAYGQSGQMREADWTKTAVDQRSRYDGNTILRGGQNPRVEPANN